MAQSLRFPIMFPVSGEGRFARTFETMAVPPDHRAVTAVCGWVYADGNVLVVRDADGGWHLPVGERRAGETFHDTLARVSWENGVRLGMTRLIGAFRTHDTDGESTLDYMVCLLAETCEVEPHRADDRALIEPSMLARVVVEWDELMDEALAYAEAVHKPTPVEDMLVVA